MSTIIILITTFCIAISIGLYVTPYITELSRELHLYDMPDSRKVHQLPIPRMGGVVFLPSASIAIAVVLVVLLRLNYDVNALWQDTTIQHFLAYLCGAMMLYTIGLYDDIHGVGYKVKFIVQIIAASMLCVSGLWIADFSHVFFIDEVPYWIGMPITVLMVVYVTNAMNLIDGIDGLASGLSCIALSVITMLNVISHSTVWAMLAIAFLGVTMAFFYYNVFHKRYKIFMGDAGSLTLGYTLSFLVLHFWQRNGVWNPYLHNIGIIALSTLVIPMFDVVRVFASRIRDGRNPFTPDKNHIHHKLLRTGLGAKMTMLTLLLISLGIIAVNYIMADFISQTLMIVADIVIFVAMHLVINIFIAKKEKKTGSEWNRAFFL